MLELLLSSLIAFLLFRMGMPSIIPILVWIPLFPYLGSWEIIAGLVGVFLVEIIVSHSTLTSLPPFSLVMGFVSAGLGLIFFSSFPTILTFLEGWISTILILATVFMVLLFQGSKPWMGLGCLFCLLVGWWGLHEWTIPAALPALLFGFFGTRDPDTSVYSKEDSLFDAFIGVLAGILPGLGPGLIGLFWFSRGPSPVLIISNLVFSMGWVVLTSHVRSFPAGMISLIDVPPIMHVLSFLLIASLLAFGLHHILIHFPFPSFSDGWKFLHVLALVLVGGLPVLGLVGLSYSASRFLDHNHLPLSLGTLLLVPSIVWFYLSL